MFKLEIKSIFAERGVKFPYSTLLKLGIPRATALKMLKGEAAQIRFDHLLILCQYLNCTPKELIRLFAEQGGLSYQNTPLQAWLHQPDMVLAQELQTLKPDELEQMKQHLKQIKAKNEQ